MKKFIYFKYILIFIICSLLFYDLLFYINRPAFPEMTRKEEKKQILLNSFISQFFEDPKIKSFNFMIGQRGLKGKIYKIYLFLTFGESFTVDEARLLIVKKHLAFLKTINERSEFAGCFISFPLSVENLSMNITFCNRFLDKLQKYPFVSQINASGGAFEYLSELPFRKKYHLPSVKENIYEAFMKVQDKIEPSLVEIGMNLKKIDIILPNYAKRQNDYLKRNSLKEYYPQYNFS